MLKKNMKVVVFNRGNKEVGVIVKKRKIGGVPHYSVMLERNYLIERLTEDSTLHLHIIYDLSMKLNTK